MLASFTWWLNRGVKPAAAHAVKICNRLPTNSSGGATQSRSASCASSSRRAVPLMAMVDVSVQPAATQIRRTNRQTRVTILAGLAGETTVPDARKVMEQTMESVAFPPGYGYTFDGSAFENESEAEQQMRHVCTRDEQHHRDRKLQQRDHARDIADTNDPAVARLAQCDRGEIRFAPGTSHSP